MKIAIDISQIVFPGTGVATYTRNLVKSLLSLEQAKRHEFILFGTSLRQKKVLEDFAEDLKKQGAVFKTVFLNLPPTFTDLVWNKIHHVKIERLIGKIDVFHSSDWVQPPTRAKKITTVHDLVVYKTPESSTSKIGLNWQNFSIIPSIVDTQKSRLHWVKKEVDCVLVDSNGTKRDLIETLSISPDKIRVIPLAVSDDFMSFSRLTAKEKINQISTVRQKYHLPENYVLAVGTKEPRKNLSRLINAFNMLKQTKTKLVLAGKYGWGDKGNLSGTNNNVVTLGFVPQSDLPALYAGAQVFVYPSLYEGFGVPLLEAFASGVPVITSNRSSLPEVGGKAAVYVNPESETDISQKIHGILSLSKTLRAKLIGSGTKQLSLFSWTKVATQTLAEYERIGHGK